MVQIIRKGVITHSQLKKEMAKDFNSNENYLKKHKFDVLTICHVTHNAKLSKVGLTATPYLYSKSATRHIHSRNTMDMIN
jgi:hypothetical protein